MQQALYRKYRPKTFEDVVGQDHITSVLKNEIKENHPAHAYLFTGSRGTGKTTCSKILAKAVNCLNPQNGDPCGKCEICLGIENGSVLDVAEIDAASNNSVDDVRALRDEAGYTPSVGKYRVYIIDEAHMLSPNAFNALLKIMEEPPAHVIFILATTEVHKIPATILSRCQSFDFKRIAKEDISARLMYVAQNEEINLTQPASLLIAELAKGGMRDALSILDVCSSSGEEITPEVVSKLSGLSDTSVIFDIVDKLAIKDCSGILTDLDKSYENSVEPLRLCEQLVEHIRELMLCTSVKQPEKYISSGKNLEKMLEQAKTLKIDFIFSALKEFQNALDMMSSSTMRSLQLEIAVIKLCSQTNKVTNNAEINDTALNKRISLLEEKLEAVIKAGVQNNFARDIPPKKAEANENPIVQVEEKLRKKAVPLKQWVEIMAVLEKENGALYGSLNNSKAYVSDNILLIECENELFLSLIRENEYAKKSLRKAAYEITGTKFKLGPFKKDMYEIDENKDPFESFIKKLDTSMEEIELI